MAHYTTRRAVCWPLERAFTSVSGNWPDDLAEAMEAMQHGHAFTVPENLFSKITDDARDEMSAQFAGA